MNYKYAVFFVKMNGLKKKKDGKEFSHWSLKAAE